MNPRSDTAHDPLRGPAREPIGPAVLVDVLGAATGRTHRADAVRGRTGGPAGNARLTAWTGLVLLVLLAVEGATLVAVGRLLGVHIVVGVLLVPVVLLKTASTGWRILRYYTGDTDYVRAGPPPLLLRLLGPLVVASTLALLGTGLGLLARGEQSFEPLGAGPSMASLHQASFIVWFGLMTVHVLARTVPALRTLGSTEARARRVPAGVGRIAVLGAVVAAGIVLGSTLLTAASWWTTSWSH